jgi:hypothetical protein
MIFDFVVDPLAPSGMPIGHRGAVCSVMVCKSAGHLPQPFVVEAAFGCVARVLLIELPEFRQARPRTRFARRLSLFLNFFFLLFLRERGGRDVTRIVTLVT